MKSRGLMGSSESVAAGSRKRQREKPPASEQQGQKHGFYRQMDLICVTLGKFLNFLSLCFLMRKVWIIAASIL